MREVCKGYESTGQRQERTSGTLHVHRTPRARGAADAQLPVAVVAPALDSVPRRIDDALVVHTQGDGDS